MYKDVKEVWIRGKSYSFTDVSTSIIREAVKGDLEKDVYGLDEIEFKTGDMVIDIGANIGMVSIYLATMYPGIYVVAIEPFNVNYISLRDNVLANDVGGRVTCINTAIGGECGKFPMIAHVESNTGGATGYLTNMNLPNHELYTADMITLDRLFAELGLSRVKLLKIDCEGAEYDILKNTTVLDKVENLSGEFHTNKKLHESHGTPYDLEQYVNQFIRPDNVRITVADMAE